MIKYLNKVLLGSEFNSIVKTKGLELIIYRDYIPAYSNQDDSKCPFNIFKSVSALNPGYFMSADVELGMNIISNKHKYVHGVIPGAFYFTYEGSKELRRTHRFLVNIPNDARVYIKFHTMFLTDKIVLVSESSEEWYADNIHKNGTWIRNITYPTHELCMKAVTTSSRALKYIYEQTPEMCKIAVSKNGVTLKYAKYKTNEICLIAVKQNGLALSYVKIPSEEMCRLAVKQNAWAIQYVNPQTIDLCLEALSINHRVVRHIRNDNIILVIVGRTEIIIYVQSMNILLTCIKHTIKRKYCDKEISNNKFIAYKKTIKNFTKINKQRTINEIEDLIRKQFGIINVENAKK